MGHAYILWIATLAYAIHIFEEFAFDRRSWARATLELPVDRDHFALVNGIVIVLGGDLPLHQVPTAIQGLGSVRIVHVIQRLLLLRLEIYLHHAREA